MDARTVARTLRELAILLEASGREPRRARSYQTAARSIEGAGVDVAAMAREGRLTELPGVGARTASAIVTLVTEGCLPELEGLRARIPAELLSRLQSGLDDPEVDVVRLDQADHLAARLLSPVLAAGPVHLSPTGGLRRRTETIDGLTFLAAAPRPGPLLDALVAPFPPDRVRSRTPSCVTVCPPGCPPVTLRVVRPEAFAGALVRDTGSAVHLDALARRLAATGHRLEGDRLRGPDGPVAARSEAVIYTAAGLHWMPPEAREAADECERYELGSDPPTLVEVQDIQGLVHVHSTWSDGKDDLATLVGAARARGAGYLVITDHSQAASYARGLDRARLALQRAEIRRLDAQVDGLTIRQGIEADILPDGRLDLDPETLSSLDVVIGSLHAALDQDRDTLHRRLDRAFADPRLQILGHPSTRRLLERDPADLDLDRVAEAAKRHGVALEINGYPRRLDAGWDLVRRHRHTGLRFVVGADAHAASQLDHVRYGVEVARRGGLGPEAILNTGSWDRFRAALRR